LIRTQAASRPKKYVAVEPEAALDRLLAEKKAELEEQESQYESIVDSLEDQLDATTPVEEPFWTGALGGEDAADLLVERLATANDRIIMVAGAPTAQFDLDVVGEQVLDELESALSRGVSVSLLMRPELVETLPESVGRRYRYELQEHDNFEVRISDGVGGTFELIDNIEVCIEVPHPLTTGETFAVIDLKDPEFAASIEDEFAPRWNEANVLKL
jgi:sugar-specific transcriptional regulator TrmB